MVADKVEYTKEDIQALRNVSPNFDALLESNDPAEFEELMKSMPKQYSFVFETEFLDLPESINDPSLQGFLAWRLSICK